MEDLYSLETVAGLLGKTGQTVRNMVKRGLLQAVYPKTGKNGRPNLMITASSYGNYILIKGERNNGKRKNS